MKIADKKFKKLMFDKIEDNEYVVVYRRHNNEFNYDQIIELQNKAHGGALIHSYDKHLMDKELIGNTGVGITVKEAKACIRKIKEKGWSVNV